MSNTVRARWSFILVVFFILLYVLNFGTLSLLKHAAFQTHAADLGNMDQPIWNTLHGRFVEETKDDGAQGTRLTDHVEPIFALVSLSFLIYDGVQSILIVQTLAIALGALPVYWLARRRLRSDWAGVVFAAVYLLMPALQAANLTEFHAVPLAVTPLLFAFYSIEEENPLGLWVAALLAMSVKEEISLLTFMLGLYVVLFRKRKLHGVLLSAVSLLWFSLTTFVIIPHYSSSGNSVYVGRYESLGGSFSGVFRAALTRPWDVINLLLSGNRLAYLGGLLAGTGFLAVLSPVSLIMASPVLLANTLSDYPAMFSGEFHYSAPVMPFIIIGAILGAGWLVDRATQLGWKRSMAVNTLMVWVLMWSLGYNYLRGFDPWSVDFELPSVTSHHRLFLRFAGQIPSDAIVSTTPPLFPHLSHRPVIYLFPVVKDAEFVLLDVSGVTDMHPYDVYNTFHELLDDREFGIVDAADGYVLLQRGVQGLAELPDKFCDFARVQDPRPRYVTEVDFGDYLRLKGFDLSDRYRWQLTTVRLYWEVLKPLPADMRPHPFFVNDEGKVVEDTTQRPLVTLIWYPPERWKKGEVVVTDTLPWDLGDAFHLGVGVLWGDNWSMWAQRVPITAVSSPYLFRLFDDDTWIRLLRFERHNQRLQLAPETIAQSPARMDHKVDVNFADLVSLLGADINVNEERLQVTLFWQAQSAINEDYTVFVHLVAPDGTLAGQHDAMPKGGALPTSVWYADEVVYDEHTVDLPLDLMPGDYRLEVGLYSAGTMERLPVLDDSGIVAGNRATIAPVTLKR